MNGLALHSARLQRLNTEMRCPSCGSKRNGSANLEERLIVYFDCGAIFACDAGLPIVTDVACPGPSQVAAAVLDREARGESAPRSPRSHEAWEESVESLKAAVARFRSKRSYVIGHNDGWEAAIAASPVQSSVGAAEKWQPISEADRSIATVQTFAETGVTLRNSHPVWVRDEDGRTYEAVWSEGLADYWWDIEGESPVDPVEFMPHPLDPRFAAALDQASRDPDMAGVRP